MRRADEQDLRDAIAEEVDELEPSEQMWQQIYERSVSRLERKRRWKQTALGAGSLAATTVAAFVIFGSADRAEPPPIDPMGPSTMAKRLPP